MSTDPAIRDHKAWLGYLQPDGLVVSPAALVDSQVLLNRNVAPLQQTFLDHVEEIEDDGQSTWAISDLKEFLTGFLEWPLEYMVGHDETLPVPEELRVPLREFGETLEPTMAFREPKPPEDASPWLLLVEELPQGTDLDEPVESAMAGWSASHTRRFERLLREAQVPIGLQFNGTHIRVVYAPRGENAGTLTFPVSAMVEIAGRPILSAFEMLFSSYRLLSAPSEARLPALLQRSREYQARVSTALAKQVLDALYELLRGFQVANGYASGELLREVLANDPQSIYGGLLTTLMRLVFLLYAEDRGLMPGSDLYVRNYSVHSLFERLRTDAEHYPDTMDHRYGAWAQLVAIFRAVYNGCDFPKLKMPARQGHLFDPDRFPFLEGKLGTVPSERVPERDGTASKPLGSERLSPAGGGPATASPCVVFKSAAADSGVDSCISLSPTQDQGPRLPLISDGVIHRVLDKLLVLDGERLSYRTLDVEQIGSVYETMMGFRLETAQGQTIALKPGKKSGAPVPLNLDELLETRPSNRDKWILDRTDYKLPGSMAQAVKAAADLDAMLAALEKRVARNATPQPVSANTMVLMPTDERRKTGSHYTPRSLTEPIVRTTLEPILKQLGEHPTPDQILELKVCDPAMGSGAFLVEACRQLADELVAAWAHHGYKPHIPEDEDEVLFARRLIAQRCLYGVDRNPMAVDLAKLSLWLATLARDHPFTFLDHSFRAGDSLVGLTKKQIAAFHWEPAPQQTFAEAWLRKRIENATAERSRILSAGDDMLPAVKAQRLKVADEALNPVRQTGDAVIAAFFSESKKNKREEARDLLAQANEDGIQHIDLNAIAKIKEAITKLREGPQPVTPFHWEIEFPEVFLRENPGFDAFVGNPPFLGGGRISGTNGDGYLDWILYLHEGAHGNGDLVAHFFRRAFNLVSDTGSFGFVATNTIGQGDTRTTGLKHICQHGGIVYRARRRMRWPGSAAVIVSVVNVAKSQMPGPRFLDGKQVEQINSFLFYGENNDDPAILSHKSLSFNGMKVYGQGFLFDDNDPKGEASSIATMNALVEKDPRNLDAIKPYIGGEQVNSSSEFQCSRYAIDFFDLSLMEVQARWPDLLSIVREKVLPYRKTTKRRSLREKWWQYGEKRPALRVAVSDLDEVIVNSQISPHLSFTFLPSTWIYSHSLNVFAVDSLSVFCEMQCRCHEVWARFFASSMKDDMRYTPSDCFDTYPFKSIHAADQELRVVGGQYYEYRNQVMVANNEGLTSTYNRFHDPNETSPDIQKLRELHDAMDRAVLDAYGWTDIQPRCEFLLDYEDEEDDEDTGRKRKKKKPWRYRWPDDIRDEVLARLLKLNADRAEEERRTGLAAAKKQQKKAKKKARKKDSQEGELF